MREFILKLYGQSQGPAKIASVIRFCVAASRRVRQQFKARGTLEPQTYLSGRKPRLTAQRKAHLQKLVSDRPDAPLAELGSRMDRLFGISSGESVRA